MDALGIDFIDLISNYWGLLMAGTLLGFNAMTVSWGSLGLMWEKPIVTLDVKPTRYTNELIDKDDYFTLSFFPEMIRAELLASGAHSYSSSNKPATPMLTPHTTEHGIVFDEAEITLVCRKIYNKPLALENVPEFAVEKYYTNEPPHCVYVGEVINMIGKSEGGSDTKLLTASCFGSFEVYANGEPLQFKRSKTKELLAYLIDRRGAVVNAREVCDRLWEDKAYDRRTVNYLHQLMADLRHVLRKNGAEKVLIKHPQGYSVNVLHIDCDFYRFLDGDKDAIRSFAGEYMSKYSWSEYTCAYLLDKAK